MTTPASESAARSTLRRVDPPEIFAYSVPGLGKDTNEDRVLWRRQGSVAVMLVTDGVSTCDLGSGEQAAEEVVRLFRARYAYRFDHLAQFLNEMDPNDPAVGWQEAGTTFLRDFFDEANAWVVSAQDVLLPAEAELPENPMCATLTMVLVVFNQVLIASAGDSPAWSYSAGCLQKLTHDDHACHSPGYRPDIDSPGALTRYVGRGIFDTERESIRPLPLEVEPIQIALDPGDLLLVGSDGVVQCIDEPALPEKTERLSATLKKALAEGLALPLVVQRLIRLGEDGLSDDNITLCAARIGAIAELKPSTIAKDENIPEQCADDAGDA